MAATFYGSLLTTVPSGFLADLWSPVDLLQIACGIFIICTAALPFLAINVGHWGVFLCRFVLGFGEVSRWLFNAALIQGALVPSINKLLSSWIPTSEKSTAISIYTTGNQIAGVIGIPLAAFLCESVLGWPSIFYLCGMNYIWRWELSRVIKIRLIILAILGLVWSLAWRLFVPNSPAECNVMSKQEREYLNSRDELCKSIRYKVTLSNKMEAFRSERQKRVVFRTYPFLLRTPYGPCCFVSSAHRP